MDILLLEPSKKDKKSLLKKRILSSVFKDTRVSIKDLHKHINNSLPTITSALNELIKVGLVLPFGAETETGGRNAHLYRISPSGAFVVGVWIENQNMHIGSYKLDLSEAYPIYTKQINKIDEIPDIIEQYLTTKPHLSSKLIGIGFVTSTLDMEEMRVVSKQINAKNEFTKHNWYLPITEWSKAISQSIIDSPNSTKQYNTVIVIRVTNKPKLSFIFDKKVVVGSRHNSGYICDINTSTSVIAQLLKPIINATGITDIVISGYDNEHINRLKNDISKYNSDISIETRIEDSSLHTQSAALTVLNRSFLNY